MKDGVVQGREYWDKLQLVPSWSEHRNKKWALLWRAMIPLLYVWDRGRWIEPWPFWKNNNWVWNQEIWWLYVIVFLLTLFVSVSFFVESFSLFHFIPLPTNAAPRDDDVVLVESDAEITGVTPAVLCVGVVDAGRAAPGSSGCSWTAAARWDCWNMLKLETTNIHR